MSEGSSPRQGTFTVIDHDDGTRRVETHIEFMRLAIMQATMAPPSNSSFSTGVMIVSGTHVLSEGHSREANNPHTHAAAIAVTKAQRSSYNHLLRGATMYTTMEPCSSEKMAKVPCTKQIIDAGIAEVVIGVKEPESFVDRNGVRDLCAAGINVVHMLLLQEECLATNIHLLH